MGSRKLKPSDIVLCMPAVCAEYFSTPIPDEHMANLASVCYDSQNLVNCGHIKAAQFVEKIVKNGHLGVLEHVIATFEIQCSRACSHQFERHRIGFSYLERSQRHVAPHDMPTVMFNGGMTDNGIRLAAKHMKQAQVEARRHYDLMVKSGVPKEIARYVLPEMTYTRVIVTANLRAWRDFISKRMDSNAQDEIRLLASSIYRHLKQYCPAAMVGLEKK